MSPVEFQTQMNRLSETFGKQAYGTERAGLIWREVKDFSGAWLERTVDDFIGAMRHAPLLPDFANAVSAERERTWKREKAQHSKEAEYAMKSLYSSGDLSMICKTITSRIEGEMPDADFGKFLKMINSAPVTELSCRTCDGSGLVFDKDERGYEFVFRCFCREGEKKPKVYPVYVRGGTR